MARSRLVVLMASWLCAAASARAVHARPGGARGHAAPVATARPAPATPQGEAVAPARATPAAPFEAASEPEGSSEEKDCLSLAWSCDNSSEVSKASARCACGDSDGNCAREACRRAEEHPSPAVRREQAESRRRVDACLHATAAPANPTAPSSARRERERPRPEAAPARR